MRTVKSFLAASVTAPCFCLVACSSSNGTDATPSGPDGGNGKGYAICIGLNAIDPGHYGTDGALAGCEPDANDMESIARSCGLSTTKLLTKQATAAAVLGALHDHAQRLEGGDLLVVSYSGHGSQVRDGNGDEPDGLDETWCLYDRQLIDDELYDAWSRFRPGVWILAFSDSCHSGTVLKMKGADVDHPAPERIKELDTKWHGVRELPRLQRRKLLNTEAMRRALGRDSDLRRTLESHPAFRRGADGEFDVVVSRDPDGPTTPDPVFVARALTPRQMVDVYDKNRAAYESLGRSIAKERSAPVKASVLSISGCEDDQLSSDIGFNGLFTWKLVQVWDAGSFQGDHPKFHTEIRQRVLQANPDQSPRLDRAGVPDAGFEGRKPYSVR